QANGHDRPPEPPGPRCSAKDRIKNYQCNRSRDDRENQGQNLFAEPWTEVLRGHAILMLAKKLLVNGERKTERTNNDDGYDDVNQHLQPLQLSAALGEIAQTGRDPRLEEKDGNGSAE